MSSVDSKLYQYAVSTEKSILYGNNILKNNS